MALNFNRRRFGSWNQGAAPSSSRGSCGSLDLESLPMEEARAVAVYRFAKK